MTETKVNKHVCVFTGHTTKDLRVLNRQCRSLQRNGWKITLVAISNPSLNPGSIEGEYNDDGIKVIGIRHWHGIWDRIKKVTQIAKIAYHQKADVYHFHDPDLLLPAVVLKLLTRKPFIYDIHEYFNITFSHKFPDIWPLRQVIGGLVWSIETSLAALCRNISVVYEEHGRKFARLGCKVVHTPNYASIQDFNPAEVSEQEWQQRYNKVLFIGSLAPERGSLVLLDIAKLVRQTHPDIEFYVTRRFHNKQQENDFMNKLNSPGFENVIKFVPNVGGKELPKIVRTAGIGLSVDQPTKIGMTSQPTKTFEYMSQSLAQVSSDLPHSRKYIKDEGCGILVKPDDPKQYADAIIKLVDNPSLAKEIGIKGQRAFIEKYNWGVVEKRLLSFYESISR